MTFPAALIDEQAGQRLCEGISVVKRDEDAAPLAEELDCVLVWRRYDGGPRGERVGECPGSDLLGILVGGHENIAGRQPGRELGIVHVAIDEMNPAPQPQAGSLRCELLAVRLPTPA